MKKILVLGDEGFSFLAIEKLKLENLVGAKKIEKRNLAYLHPDEDQDDVEEITKEFGFKKTNLDTIEFQNIKKEISHRDFNIVCVEESLKNKFSLENWEDFHNLCCTHECIVLVYSKELLKKFFNTPVV